MLTIQDLQGNRKQANRERLMRKLFGLAAILSIAISLLILYVLVDGAINFMVGIDWDWSLLTDTGWFPRRERFDLRTIITGSIIMGTVAMFVAVPFGLGTAIYLSEYASRRVRSVVKPIIEVLAGIPSVIVGFFALKVIAPDFVDPIFNPTTSRNMLVAGLGIGILVIPIMASLSEDALSAVPGSLREASYGVGAKRVDHGHQGRHSGRGLRARGGVHHLGVAGHRRDHGRDDGGRLRRFRSLHRLERARARSHDDRRDDQCRRWHRRRQGGAGVRRALLRRPPAVPDHARRSTASAPSS